MPTARLQVGLGEKDDCSQKNGVVPCGNRKTLKTLRYSESFNFFCFGAKSKPFSRIFVSVSVKSVLLSLSTLDHTKLPDKLQCLLRTDRTLI